MYAYGRCLKESTVRLLEEYNSSEKLKADKHDRQFVAILTNAFFAGRELAGDGLDENAVNLMKGP